MVLLKIDKDKLLEKELESFDDDSQAGRVIGDSDLSSNDKEKRKRFSKFFYRVSNHSELNKIGSSYYDDYLKGVKTFAITSTGYSASQQKTILGLASYFDHREELSILIVSNELEQGCFSELIKESERKDRKVSSIGGKSISFYEFHHHFDFVSFNEIIKLCATGTATSEYEDAISEIFSGYDVVFCDVPELSLVQRSSQYYFPVAMKFEKLTIIVKESVSSNEDVNKIKQLFHNYGVSLKGLLFEEAQPKAESFLDKLAFWRGK